jgi:transposase
MMVIGIDAHKRSHTAVTIDDNGRQQSTKTVGTTTQDHLRLLQIHARVLNDTLTHDYRHWYPDFTHTPQRQEQAA